MEDKSVEDVCEWLSANADMPESVLDDFRGKNKICGPLCSRAPKVFPKSLQFYDCVSVGFTLDQEMDVCAGLATCPGDMIPKVGFRLKIHNALRTLYNQVS